MLTLINFCVTYFKETTKKGQKSELKAINRNNAKSKRQKENQLISFAAQFSSPLTFSLLSYSIICSSLELCIHYKSSFKENCLGAIYEI
jgi:hypothetical protein